MARATITPTSFVQNSLNAATFSTLLAAKEGWVLDISDNQDIVLVGLSTHTSAVEITLCAGSSEMTTSYNYPDFILKGAGNKTTSIATSSVSVMFIETARFKSSSGIYIDSTITGSTAISFMAFYNKPTL